MSRPNVVLVHTDQQRWDSLGVNGNEDVHTPNLDRLVAEGVSCRRYLVQNGVCMPSRASYLTGLYPSQLRIYRNGTTVPESIDTIATHFDQYGYRTANLGKLHFTPHANRDHRERHHSYGFDRLELSDEPGPYPDAYRAWVRQRAPEQLEEISVGLPPAAETWQKQVGLEDDIAHSETRFEPRPRAFPADAELTHSAFVADRTIEFIEQQGEEPFLAVAGFYSPHKPWVVPQQYLDLYDPESFSLPTFPDELERERGPDRFTDAELRRARHGYYAMVSEVDHHVGRILDALDATGQREETIVVFTSDHGEYLGEHLRYGKGWPAPDAVSRVPCLVRWPDGLGEPGRTTDALVEAVDLLPTLLAAAGIQAPPRLQGRSMLPVLRGESDGRSSVLLESAHGKAIRTDDYRYLVRQDGEEFLHDLDADPHGYHDMSERDEYRDVLDAHRRTLLERTTTIDTTDGRPREWAY